MTKAPDRRRPRHLGPSGRPSPPDPLRFNDLEEASAGVPEEGPGPALALGILGHEIRTPLASIKSSLDVVRSGDAGPLNRDQMHFLGRVAENLTKLENLVDDLLEDARRGSGPPEVRLRDLDLAAVLGQAAAPHAQAAARAGLHWDASGLPRRFPVVTDPQKVTRILDNLLGNAVKYCRRGDTLQIRLQPGPQPGFFRLQVQDTGPGMDLQTRRRVFEPFFRAADVQAAGVLGAGLGLHITRRLVRALGGRIELESRPGGGTLVTVHLPGYQDPARGPRPVLG